MDCIDAHSKDIARADSVRKQGDGVASSLSSLRVRNRYCQTIKFVKPYPMILEIRSFLEKSVFGDKKCYRHSLVMATPIRFKAAPTVVAKENVGVKLRRCSPRN